MAWDWVTGFAWAWATAGILPWVLHRSHWVTPYPVTSCVIWKPFCFFTLIPLELCALLSAYILHLRYRWNVLETLLTLREVVIASRIVWIVFNNKTTSRFLFIASYSPRYWAGGRGGGATLMLGWYACSFPKARERGQCVLLSCSTRNARCRDWGIYFHVCMFSANIHSYTDIGV